MNKFKATLRRLLHKVGYDVRRLQYAITEERAVRSLLEAARPEVVLDIGANIGQFHDLLRNEGYRGLVVSFEPLADAHATLVKRAPSDANWRIAPLAALGSKTDEVEINVSENAVSSSLLPMNENHVSAAPQSRYVGKQKVRVERLDQITVGLIPGSGSLYLKVDTQGYEKEVLAGATGILGRVSGMQLELSTTALYEGAPSFTEIMEYVSSKGFELFTLLPGFRNVSSGRAYQLEGFFIRKDLRS